MEVNTHQSPIYKYIPTLVISSSEHTGPDDVVIGKQFSSTKITLPNGHVKLPPGRYKHKTASVNGRRGILLHNVDKLATINKKLFIPTTVEVDTKNHRIMAGGGKFSSEKLTDLTGTKLTVPKPLPDKTESTIKSPPLNTSTKISSASNVDTRQSTELLNDDNDVIYVSGDENCETDSLTVDVSDVDVVDESGDYVQKNILSPKAGMEEVVERISVPKSLLEHDSENITSIQQPKPLACFLNKNISSEQPQRSNVTTNVSLTDIVVTEQTDKMVMNPALSCITNASSVLSNLASQISDQMTSNVPQNSCVFTTLGNISPVFSTSSDSASCDTTMTASPKQFSDFTNMSKTELLTQEDFSQFIVSPPGDISNSHDDSVPETKSISRSVTPVTSDCMRIPTVPNSDSASSVKQSLKQLTQTCISSAGITEKTTDDTTNADGVLQQSSDLSTVSYIDALISENFTKVSPPTTVHQVRQIPPTGGNRITTIVSDPLNTKMSAPNYSQSTVGSNNFSNATVTRENNSAGTIITSPTSGGIEKVFIPPNMRSKFDSSLSVTSDAPITVTKLPTVFSNIVTTTTMTSSNHTKPSSSKPIISPVSHTQTPPSPILAKLYKQTPIYYHTPATSTKLASILYSNPAQNDTQYMHSYRYPSLPKASDPPIPQLPLRGASTVIVPVPSVPSTKYYQVKHTPTMNVLTVTNSTPNSYSIIGPGLQYPVYKVPQTVSVSSRPTQVVDTKRHIAPVYTSPSWNTPITQAGKPSTNVPTKGIPPSTNIPRILHGQVLPQPRISSATPIITVDATDSSGPKQYVMVNVAEKTTEPGKVPTFKRILVPMPSFNVLPKDTGNTKTTTVRQVPQIPPTGGNTITTAVQQVPQIPPTGGNTITTIVHQVPQQMQKPPTGFVGLHNLRPSPSLVRPIIYTPKPSPCHARLPGKYPPLQGVPVTVVPVSNKPHISIPYRPPVSKPISTISTQGISMTTPKLVSQSPSIPPITELKTIKSVINSSSITAWLNSYLNKSVQQSTPAPTVSQSAHQSTPTVPGSKAAIYKYSPLFLTSSTTVTSYTKPASSTISSTLNKCISVANIRRTAPTQQSHLEKYRATIRARVKTTPVFHPKKPSSLPVSIVEKPDSLKDDLRTDKSNDLCPNPTHYRITSEDNPQLTLSLHKDEPPMLLREEPSTEDLGANQDACMPLLEPVIESPNTEHNLQELTGKTDPILVESPTESDLDPYSALRSLIYKNKRKPTIPLDPRQFPSVRDAASVNNVSDTSDLGIKIESVYSLKTPDSTNKPEPTAPKRPRWVGSRSKIIDDSKFMKHPHALPVPLKFCNKKTNAFVVLERSNLFSEPVNVRKIRKLRKRRACDLICRTAALRLLCHNGLLKPHQFEAPDPKPDTGQVSSCSPKDVNIPRKRSNKEDIEGGTTKPTTKRKYTKNPQVREKKEKLPKKHESGNKRPERQLHHKFVHLPQEDKQFFTMTSGDKNLLIPVKQNIFYPRSYIYGDGDVCFDMIPKNRLYALLDYHSKAIKTEERQKIYKLSSSAVRRMFASDTLPNGTKTVIRCHEIEARFEKDAGEMIDLTQTCISSAGITEQTTDHTTKPDGVLQQSSDLATASFIDALISDNLTKVGPPVSDPISAMETLNTAIVESYATDGVDLTLQTNTNLRDHLSTDMVQRTVTYEASETIQNMETLEMELTMNTTNEASLESENSFDMDESLAPVSSSNQKNPEDILVPNDQENTSQVSDMFNSTESPTDREIPSNSQVDAHTEEMVSLLSNNPEPAEDVESLQSVIKQQEAELMKLKKWIKKNSVNLDEIDDF